MARNHQWTVPRVTLNRERFQAILEDIIAAFKAEKEVDEAKVYEALVAVTSFEFLTFDTKELLNASIARGDVDPDVDTIFYGNMKKTKRVVDFQIDEPPKEKKPKPTLPAGNPPGPNTATATPAETTPPADEPPAEDPRQTQVPGTERPTPGVGSEPATTDPTTTK